MAPHKKIGYFTKLDPKLREAMRRYKAAVGVPEAQQLERALRAWLNQRPEAWPRRKTKSVAKKSKRKRPVGRPAVRKQQVRRKKRAEVDWAKGLP